MNTKTISISIFKLVMPLFVLLFVQFAANAQQFDLSGTWTVYSADGTKAPKPVTISHMFPSSVISHTVDISNGEGRKIIAIYSANGTIFVSEKVLGDPKPEDSKMSGNILQNGTLIRWSDNTAWEKGFTASPDKEKTPKKPALSAYDMNLAMTWIAAQVSAQRLPFCYRQSFGRGVGEPASTCANGWEKIGLRCQPKCIAGYERSGTHCRAVCPQGFTDIGSYCQKPAAYGRGAGYAWKFGDKAFSLDAARERCTKDNPQGCEQNGAIFYPKCKPGFHNVGANICSPNCPSNWQDTGTGCYKPATPANLSGDALGCKPGMEGKDGLCYNKCNKADYSGVGPVCWQNCPSQMPVNCGAGCATTSKDCAMAVTDMVISPIMAAISLATLGGASGVTVAGNTIKGGATTAATKAPGIIAKMKAIYAKIKADVELAKSANKVYKTSSSSISQLDLVLEEFSENFAEMTSYEINKKLEDTLHPKQVKEIKLEWAKRHFYLMGQTNADLSLRNALTLASVVDPTGLLAVEKAFYHPVCKNSTPFPILENYVE